MKKTRRGAQLKISIVPQGKLFPKEKEKRDAMILANIALVYFFARKTLREDVDFHDILSAGKIGLIKAVDRFDEKKGFAFSTYAGWWIRQEINRDRNSHGYSIRIPENKLLEMKRRERVSPDDMTPATKWGSIADYKTSSLDKGVLGGEGDDVLNFIPSNDIPPEDVVAKTDMEKALGILRARLSPQEWSVLEERFGLLTGKSLSLEEMRAKMNLSRQRIWSIEKKALEKAKKALQFRGITSSIL